MVNEIMILFITVLRALAACLITNSHYTGIYPIDALANGGMTGNMIFCAVSGYCLYHIRDSFPRWYGTRLIRCYLPTWLITVVYLLIGAYTLTDRSLFAWLVYPTGYHFLSSIILLYIPFYFILRTQWLRDRLPQLMAAIGVLFLLYYLLIFDRSTFHILDMRQLPVRTLLLVAMLLGAWARRNDDRNRDHFSLWLIPASMVLSGMDLVLRNLLSKGTISSQLQILSPLIFLAQLYVIFRLFAGLDGKLQKLPAPVIRCITFLSQITLEIYVVQGPLIEWLRPLLGFPLNWVTITASILAAATALHLVSTAILKLFTPKPQK